MPIKPVNYCNAAAPYAIKQSVGQKILTRCCAAACLALAVALLSACATDDVSGGYDAGDPQDYRLIHGWHAGNEVQYYDFGPRTPLHEDGTPLTAPVYYLVTGKDASGEPIYVEGQHPIFDIGVKDEGYSDLREVVLVTVPADYEANSVKSLEDLQAAGFAFEETGAYHNLPVVAEDSTLEGGEEMLEGWYRGQELYYVDFGENPATALPVYLLVTEVTDDPISARVEGQRSILPVIPTDANYTAFWPVVLVTVPSDYVPDTLKSEADVLASGYQLTPTTMNVNCPIVIF